MKLYRVWPTKIGLKEEMILVLDENGPGTPLLGLGTFPISGLRFVLLEDEARDAEVLVLRALTGIFRKDIPFYDVGLANVYDFDEPGRAKDDGDMTESEYASYLIRERPDEIRKHANLAGTASGVNGVIHYEEEDDG